MSVTIPTKYVGETRVRKVPSCECVKTDEDRIEDYIKREMNIYE